MNVKAVVLAAVAPLTSWRCWRPLRRKLLVAEEVSALRTLGNAKREVPPDES
jgi:hypothetical protein